MVTIFLTPQLNCEFNDLLGYDLQENFNLDKIDLVAYLIDVI